MNGTATISGAAAIVTVAAVDSSLAVVVAVAFMASVTVILFHWSKGETITFRKSIAPLAFGTFIGSLVAMIGWEYVGEYLKSPNVDVVWIKCAIAFVISFAGEPISKALLNFKLPKAKP